jgi:peptidoglycan/xylan/chitin deacetylase (PgdA/CDA1 family)
LAAYFALPWWIKKRLTRAQAERLRAAGRVCLTFDDGPDPQTTPRLLDLLDSAGARATFFLIGRRAERHPELVQAILDRGHEIGEHGYDHVNAWKASPWRYWRDLARSERVFRRYARPGRPRLFRPPHGKMNLLTLLYLALSGARPVFWSVDPKDFEPWWDAPTIAERIRAGWREGGIVLLHDGRIRSSGLSAPSVTLEALRAALKDVRAGSMIAAGEGLWPQTEIPKSQ